jgi:hypothetical protein
MSVEIHAAIVGGVLAGASVVLGIVGTESLRRAHERRSIVQTNATTIAVTYAWVLGAMADEPWAAQLDTTSKEWKEAHADLVRRLTECIAQSRGFHRARKVRRRAETLGALVVGYSMRFRSAGTRMSRKELGEIVTATAALMTAVGASAGLADKSSSSPRFAADPKDSQGERTPP